MRALQRISVKPRFASLPIAATRKPILFQQPLTIHNDDEDNTQNKVAATTTPHVALAAAATALTPAGYAISPLGVTLLSNLPLAAFAFILDQGDRDSAIGFFDFQLSIIANFSRDVSYFIGTSLSVEDRRKYEMELIGFYLTCLKEEGVEDVPSVHDTWELYSKAFIWSLVIGWLICPSNNYGEEIWKANVSKLVAAVMDLRSFQTVGVYPKYQT